jgi:hypothetical protein
MKTYQILASSISYFTLEIEAEDEHQAWLEAKQCDGSDFHLDGDGDWEVIDIKEINHAN